MIKFGRRQFLTALGFGPLAGALPVSIARALEIPANNQTGTIQDVEHIIILMQENRSFDHYFGTLRGVRGFGDPRAVRLPSGKSVFEQPNGKSTQFPFRPNVPNLGATFLPDPPHGWNDTHAAWNNGQHDQWIANKGIVAMTHQERQDIPYQFALADAFTVCDAYHCSIMGPTDPNRYHMWTGWVGNDGLGFGPVITNAEAGYDWSTFPERMQQAGITWKVYQDIGVGLDAAGFWGWTGSMPYIGNYGDNSLLYFIKYQAALPGNPLADRAKTGTNALAAGMNSERLFDIFRQDVQQGTLPQVSYIAAPEAFTEHPNWAPDFGAWYVSQIVDILVANPAVFSKTVLFINYDEEGGFFDHQPPPAPPQTAANGLSTVSTVNEIYTAGGGHPSGPYGLGMRVPMLVISPWSKGGWVSSQVFDHTSLIRFIEKRFPAVGVETNITPWRRAVAGDLTSAFDFVNPNSPADIVLPSTTGFRPADFSFHKDYNVNAHKNEPMPKQEPGVRPARAVPYVLNVHGSFQPSDNSFRIDFTNTGTAAAVFQVRSAAVHQPRAYTVEPGKSLTDAWPLTSVGVPLCDLSVYGPNGFYREFRGSVPGLRSSQLDVTAQYAPPTNSITLVIRNDGSNTAAVNVVDQYTGQSANVSLAPAGTQFLFFALARTSGWYDFVITLAADSTIQYRVAGHLETGAASISDPLLGGSAL